MFRERKVRRQPLSPNRMNPIQVSPSQIASSLPFPLAKTAAPKAPAVDLQWEMDRVKLLRRITFYFGLVAIFIRFSAIHEALASLLGQLYLLYLVLPPAIVGIVATGGIRRTLQATSSRYWMAFLLWISLSAVFSYWRGGSFAEWSAYVKSEILMLFVIAGLVVTWKECKLVMYTLALAGLADLAISLIFMRQESYRIDLAMGQSTIGNANDLAAHLILLMAFLLYLVLGTKLPTVVRLLFIPAIGFGLFLIISTASRGALIALFACFIFVIAMGRASYRTALLAFVPIVVLVALVFVPRETLMRLGTLFSQDVVAQDNQDLAKEAEGSSGMRSELLKKSVQYTIQHPVFGLGLGQFASYEGGESTQSGLHGMWHQTHNIFTQISSECGIPALIFFVCAIVSAFRLALKTYRQTRANPADRDIAAAAFCLMLGIVGFMTAAAFLNLAYRFYAPAFCGLCIALYTSAQHELSARRASASDSPVAPVPLSAPLPVQ